MAHDSNPQSGRYHISASAGGSVQTPAYPLKDAKEARSRRRPRRRDDRFPETRHHDDSEGADVAAFIISGGKSTGKP